MKKYQVIIATFAATVRNVSEPTCNVKAAQAISEGYLYGLNGSGKAVVATNAAGSNQPAVGFALSAMTTAQAAANKNIALSTKGVVDFLAADIIGGAFTAGAEIWVGTAGKPTSTKPTTNGEMLQPIGFAISTTQAFLNVAPPLGKFQTAGNSTLTSV